MWKSANSSITGYATSTSDMASLHDVSEGIDDEEECHKTDYILQFMWRDLTSMY
jgi:hypothetical protein